MKRMVLIPEEKLLRYEERDKQKPEILYGRGEKEEEEPKVEVLSDEMIVRGSQKHENKSPGPFGPFKRKRRCYHVG